jgi:hypothetical protein
MHCSYCNAVLAHDAAFCSYCGTTVRNAVTGPTQRLHNAPRHGGLTTGICPQCSASTVYVDRDLSEYIKRKQLGTNTVIIAEGIVPVMATTTHYVCITCGYLECYLLDPSDLALIQKQWTQVDSGFISEG